MRKLSNEQHPAQQSSAHSILAAETKKKATEQQNSRTGCAYSVCNFALDNSGLHFRQREALTAGIWNGYLLPILSIVQCKGIGRMYISTTEENQ